MTFDPLKDNQPRCGLENPLWASPTGTGASEGRREQARSCQVGRETVQAATQPAAALRSDLVRGRVTDSNCGAAAAASVIGSAHKPASAARDDGQVGSRARSFTRLLATS